MTTLRREDLIRALPYARRYARAVTGSQQAGDTLVADCLRETLANPSLPPAGITDARQVLYWGVTHRFDRGAGGSDLEPGAAPHDVLSTKQRQLLLLTSLEDVSADDAAPILGLDLETAHERLVDAREKLRASAATEVLIIEDELIIAMDLEELVQSCGHRVVGVAASEAEAIAIAKRTRPGLILADINLGLGGDGTNAVSTILQSHYAPVIFVTAYPERLLTGDAIEPAFVITKPFEPLTLAIATYQAVTGGVQLDSV
jgi:CheY-like chemotaxis protein